MDKQRFEKIVSAKKKKKKNCILNFYKINRLKMNKSTRTMIIFLKNYVKKLSKHTINLNLRSVKMT